MSSIALVLTLVLSSVDQLQNYPVKLNREVNSEQDREFKNIPRTREAIITSDREMYEANPNYLPKTVSRLQRRSVDLKNTILKSLIKLIANQVIKRRIEVELGTPIIIKSSTLRHLTNCSIAYYDIQIQVPQDIRLCLYSIKIYINFRILTLQSNRSCRNIFVLNYAQLRSLDAQLRKLTTRSRIVSCRSQRSAFVLRCSVI